MTEARSELALETRKLSCKFGGLVAIDNLDFTVTRGELRCVIGPNGAGKSTLFNLITGRIRPTSGRVFLNGADITHVAPHDACRKGLGRKFQVPNIFADLSVFDNLRVARQGKSNLRDLLFTRRDALLDEEVEAVLGDIRLSDKRHAQAGALSHGEKQWLEIGMLLINRPQILLLDEPTAGMTVEETLETAKLIKSVAAGLTTVIIEHDLNFVRAIANVITVLHRGAKLAEGPLAEIAQDQRVHDVYLGKQEL